MQCAVPRSALVLGDSGDIFYVVASSTLRKWAAASANLSLPGGQLEL
jgi:hypothetical protein